MKQFPTELVIQIIKHNLTTTPLFAKVLQSKSNKKELLSYCLVNSLWRTLAQVELFRSVDLLSHQVPAFIEAIKGTKLSFLVRRIRIEKTWQSITTEGSPSQADVLLTLFKECRKVIEVQVEGFYVLDINMIARELPTLQSLLIGKCSINPPLSTPFPVLKHLVLSATYGEVISQLTFNSTTFPSLISLYVDRSNPLRTLITGLKSFEKPLEHLAIPELSIYDLITSTQREVVEAVQNLQFLTLLTPQFFSTDSSNSIPTTPYDPKSLSRITSSLKCFQLHPFPISDSQSAARLERFSEIIDSCSSNLQLLLCSDMNNSRSETNSWELGFEESWVGENCWKKQKLIGFEKGYTVREIEDDSPESFFSVIRGLNSVYEPRIYKEKFREDFIKDQLSLERKRNQFWGLRKILSDKIYHNHQNSYITFATYIFSILSKVTLCCAFIKILHKSFFAEDAAGITDFLQILLRFFVLGLPGLLLQCVYIWESLRGR